MTGTHNEQSCQLRTGQCIFMGDLTVRYYREERLVRINEMFQYEGLLHDQRIVLVEKVLYG